MMKHTEQKFMWYSDCICLKVLCFESYQPEGTKLENIEWK